MLQWALKYLRQGFSIIPIRPNGKEPLISWTEYQSRLATEAEVQEWFTKWPDANIGIVTGAISGVVVVDLDGADGLSSAASLGLQSCAVSLTGNGKHLWYKHSGLNVSNAVRQYPGIDIRGDGGYVLAAPSIHPNGKRYRWLQNFVNVASLPVFPSELLIAPPVSSEPQGKAESWIATALKEMKDGNIDDTLFTICSRLRADNWSSSDALVLLQPHAERVGATPGHLEEKIENVWTRYEPNEKPLGRVVESFQQSRSVGEGLVIHSPTNPQSWERFNQARSPVENGAERLLTGYGKLDAMLKGGLKSSRLFTVAARTGVGKTNWLIGAARTLCVQGKKVLLFSTEMPYAQIWERYISTLDDPKSFNSHKFFVCDSFAPDIETVEKYIKETRPDVFMFDHINHVSEDQKELGAFMQGLNFLRRKYECAGIVTAQLNRQADWVDIKTGEKVTPRMSMIKGSGTIEQASSRVLLLSETRVTNDLTEIVGNLDKNDNGPKGLIYFGLRSNPYRMVEL